MTTMTTTKITIAMSERRPVTIDRKAWPVVAWAKAWDNQHECQANHVWEIAVREHADGRRLVYCEYDSGPGGTCIGFRPIRGGYLLDQPDLGPEAMAESTIRAIRRCAGIIDRPDLGDECIADLPAETLD
jgi:hypothetical protein